MNRFEANLAMSLLLLLVARTDPAPDPVFGTILGILGVCYIAGAMVALWRDR